MESRKGQKCGLADRGEEADDDREQAVVHAVEPSVTRTTHEACHGEVLSSGESREHRMLKLLPSGAKGVREGSFCERPSALRKIISLWRRWMSKESCDKGRVRRAKDYLERNERWTRSDSACEASEVTGGAVYWGRCS